MQQLILNEKLFCHFWEVNTAVVEMNIESRSIPSPPLREDRLNAGRHNMLHEALCIKSNKWKPLAPPNSREHKLSSADSRVHALRHFVARARPL
jgi:hypothetical protein